MKQPGLENNPTRITPDSLSNMEHHPNEDQTKKYLDDFNGQKPIEDINKVIDSVTNKPDRKTKH